MHGPPDSVLDSSPQSTPLASDALLVEACEDLEALLRSGQAAQAEAYLTAHPALSDDPEAALDLIYVEFATRRELGETPKPDEYLARFPQWRDLLQRQFQLELLLDSPASIIETRGDSEAEAKLPLASSGDRFLVGGLLARGGIGRVMRATDTELRREVAVKEIQPALAANAEVRERFLREAEITGKLEHPGIVPVYGLGRDAEGRPFYAMRLVHGKSFQQASEEFHRLPADQRRYAGLEFQKLLRRFLHVCHTVAYAHSRSVIHRDLKPENILLGPFGETLVVDWGLAKVAAADDLHLAQSAGTAAADASADASEPGALTTSLAHLSSDLTRDAGEWIGTPAYMSPEQALGQAHRVGPQGDVYSLGATLYMLLTGQAPLVGSSIEETLRRVIAGDFPRPRELCRAVPPPLEAICLKAMARRPEDRYASPNDLADDLERWLADEPLSAARDTIIAKMARWGRRNRTRVVAATIALIVVTVISLAAAILINGERLRADRERIKADRQRVEADRRNARLAFDRGYALTQNQEHGAGLLWYARALAHAPREDAPLRRVILTNMNAARHHLLRRGEIFAHTANLKTAAISADGRWLATADYEDQARVRDIDSGAMLAECTLTRRPMTAHIGEDGTAVFAAATGKAISLERLPAAATEAGLPATVANTGDVNCAAFSADGSMLATGGSGRETHARLWRISDGQLLAEFPHPRSVEQVVFWPGHDGLATVSSDGQLRLWKFDRDRPDWELKLQAGLVAHVAFTRDGKQIIVGDTQGHLSCFDVDARRWLFELGRESGQVTAVACAADSQTVAAAWTSGIARTWNLADRRQLLELLRIDRHTQLVLFRPRTQQMLVASEPRAVVLWDVPDASQVGLPLGQGLLTAVAFSPDRKTVVTGSQVGTVVLRDAATGKTQRQLPSHEKSVRVVAFRRDGAVVLTASHDGTARLCDVATGKPQGDLMDHRPGQPGVQVETAAFSKDGRYVLTGDNVGRIQIWDGNTGVPVRPLAKYEGAVLSLRLSPDGERVVAGYSVPDNGVRMWDLASGNLLWTVWHGNTVRSVEFSPNGKLVLSASNDVTARLWNAADGQQVGPNLTHRGEVFVALFSPDGLLAMTGSYDATVRLWEVPSGRPVGEPMRHEGMVTSADFRTSKVLLTGGSVDRSARLWDVTTCLPLSPPLVHNAEVAAVGLRPDGKMVYTGRLWHLPQPLPDEPALVDLWVKLATQRKFTAGDTIEWLRPADVAAAASEFQARTGQSWEEWGKDQ